MLFSFTRPDWVEFHGWASLAIVLIVSIHLAVHWRWIVCTLRNYPRKLRSKAAPASS
ncbi:MAG: hypothetical protein HC875_30365 [Anaerolineales bacterium]|nr:hypothetical protein [Anaerolineales bacterium]